MSNLKSLFESIGLPKLAYHYDVFLISLCSWQLIFSASSYLLSRIPGFIGNLYRSQSVSKKIDFAAHVVSHIHALVIVWLAYPILSDPELSKDKLFGYSYTGGLVYAICSGYFLWDTIFSLRYLKYFGLGFFLHGISCFFVFILSFRPFLMYYGSIFLLFELSTPFLNIHWFLDRIKHQYLDRIDSKNEWTKSSTPQVPKWLEQVQFANGVLLLCVFFAVRIVFGLIMSYQFFVSISPLFQNPEMFPQSILIGYSAANVLLNSLNIFWCLKMVRAVIKKSKGVARGGRRTVAEMNRYDSGVATDKPNGSIKKLI
ncbi:TLC domain-containing protein [Paraphysoderma sedebokerense]|nr:TLC domain-containing protein [Paraphysoderma sedebokerense]